MKKLFVYVAIFATVMFSVSCQKNNESAKPDTPSEERLKINLSMSVDTKVTDTYYETGDQVGIYVVKYNGSNPGTLASSGNAYDNVRHTLDGTWKSDVEMYWGDRTTPADFYCYHPYGSPSDVNSYSFSVKKDQSLIANYKASDFAWGKASGIAPTEELIMIGTKHLMSSVVITVTPGSGFTEESLAASDVSVGIRNVLASSLVNLSDGSISATGQPAEIIPYSEEDTYKALVVPQTVADGTALVVVTVNGVEYTLKKGVTFTSGKQYRLTVSVNKTSSGVNVGIDGWETDDIDYGGSAE